ncbi:hypothetical protein [Hymenobacter segetis]|uniref:Uncharacterized protein n=1 Tax=Hymenobacter segetis TaxID=2025509 RepID=A0ABU9LT36_9BACT
MTGTLNFFFAAKLVHKGFDQQRIRLNNDEAICSMIPACTFMPPSSSPHFHPMILPATLAPLNAFYHGAAHRIGIMPKPAALPRHVAGQANDMRHQTGNAASLHKIDSVILCAH